jgi:hypothetical protein
MAFLDPRDDLAPNGAVFVGRIDQIKEVRCNSQGQLCVGQASASVFFWRQRRHKPSQLIEGRDAILELPLPAIPVGFGYIGPEPPAC